MQAIKTHCFEYYYGSGAEQFSFYRIPKVMMTAPHFKKLSCDAKILYGLMLDRMGLSMKNGWIDDENKVYIFFTLEDVQENLNCSHTTGVKIFAELDVNSGIGLIERVKQGQGKPTRIYVKNFNLMLDDVISHGSPDINKSEVKTSTNKKPRLQENGSQDFKNVEVKTSMNKKSRLPKNRSPDFQNVDSNKTNQSQTDSNDTEYQSIYPSKDAKQYTAILDDTAKKIELYREIIHENIDYECLIRGYDVERVDEYVGLMLDVICAKNKTVRIGRGEYPVEVVRSRFLKLDHSHLEYVMDRMAKNTTKIRNIRNYLLTALYNSFTSIDGYYQAEVNHDFYGDKT